MQQLSRPYQIALGALLVFALADLKLQPNGGRGLTLLDLDAKDALVSVAAFSGGLRLLGSGRGGKPKEELLKAAALEPYAGKRARKGKVVVGMKAQRAVAALPRRRQAPKASQCPSETTRTSPSTTAIAV